MAKQIAEEVAENSVDHIASTTLSVIDNTLDDIEGKLDVLESGVEKAVTITKNNPWIVAAALVAGAGLGGFVAWKITKKRLTAQFDAELTDELEKARHFRVRLEKSDEFETPQSAAQALIPEPVQTVLNTYQGAPAQVPTEKVAYNHVPPAPVVEETTVVEAVVVEEPVATAVDRNVFNPRTDPRDWDYDAEIVIREENPHRPYVISREEFDENTNEHDQNSCTYYEGDDVLCDERNSVIETVDKLIGDDNLTRFGHGSHDVNVVLVRNDDLEIDFEIIRDPGHFAVEVLGLDAPEERTLQHSRQRQGRRRRDE